MSVAVPTPRRSLADWIGTKVRDPLQRPFAVIAKSTDICNYRCSYCYVEHGSTAPIMSLDTAKIAIDRVAAHVGPGRPINFIWHGGEPLLADAEFFAGVVEHTASLSRFCIRHCLQTNGSRLTDEFLAFCLDSGIAVSLSFDGPAEIHDANRRDARGRGTHTRTLEALARLRRAGLASGCVCVLHRQNVDRVDELYDFFRGERLNVRINPVVRSGRAASHYNDLSIAPREYGKAMIRLFDRWFDDDATILVEPLHTILGNFVGPTIWGCDYHGRCLESIISINPDGEVYPCGRFAGLVDFRLGDIHTDSIATLFSSPLYRRLSQRSADVVPGCRRCSFREVCNGGCMITAHMADGDIFGQDYYCEGRKMLFAHVARRLRDHLERVAVPPPATNTQEVGHAR